MTFAYPRNTSASSPSSLPFYTPKRAQSPSFLGQVTELITPVTKQWLSPEAAHQRWRRTKEAGFKVTIVNLVKSIFTIPNAIILLWLFSIRWGERKIFEDHINQCLWENWEDWVSNHGWLLQLIQLL